MNLGSRKKGYALSLLMIALLVISLGVVAAIPLFSMKKDTVANTSAYVKKCIVDESAADPNTLACAGAIMGLTKGFDKDYNSVLYYLNDAAYKNAALKVVKASCDEDGSKACNILLDRCASNSDSFANTCNIASLDNDLYYYISMASSDSSTLGYLGKDYIKTKGVEYYLQGMPNFKNAVDAACNANINSTACDIAGDTKTRIYNFNSPQRSKFFESKPTNGINFHDGIVDLYPASQAASYPAYCWGDNTNGRLGDNTTTSRNVPTAVSGGLTFSKISAGNTHTCGIAESGYAYCWGYNNYGQIGDNTVSNRSIPTPVSGGLTFSDIAAGGLHTCGITTAGNAYCWGYNNSGQIGDNTINGSHKVPTQVVSGSQYKQLAVTGSTSCALTTTGLSHCWGYNFYGQIGDNTTGDKSKPTAEALGLTFSKLAEGNAYTCGLTESGAAYCWGLNNNGQIGDNTISNRKLPTEVKDPAGNLPGLTFSEISTGSSGTSCGITTTGAAYCWGDNNYGQIGDNTTSDRKLPKAVLGGLAFSQIDGSGSNFPFNCGITTTGDAYCWGDNTYGQLGIGSTGGVFKTPILVNGGYSYSQLSAGYIHTASLVKVLQNKAYITTTDNNNITGIVGGVKSCTITATELADTKIRGLVSFDGRNSWLKCTSNCDNPTTRTWGTVASGCNPTTNSCLNNTLISTNGNTITEIQDELINLNIASITDQTGKLDFAFYMETDTTGLITPFIDTVSITFLKGR